MKIISARDFRENQSKYLGFVDKGESVILQVRGGCYKIMPVSDDDVLINRYDIPAFLQTLTAAEGAPSYLTIGAKPQGNVLYILGGCNGAGKTTASRTVLPELFGCKEFINADEIAHGLSPYNPGSADSMAARLMLERVNEFLKGEQSFSIETTLSTRSYKGLVEKAHAAGFYVCLVYFFLDSVEVAKQRVAARVKAGGHNIPTDVIERRYHRGLRNLFELFMPVVDEWHLYDNTNLDIKPVALGGLNSDDVIVDDVKFNKVREYGYFKGQ